MFKKGRDLLKRLEIITCMVSASSDPTARIAIGMPSSFVPDAVVHHGLTTYLKRPARAGPVDPDPQDSLLTIQNPRDSDCFRRLLPGERTANTQSAS